MWRDAGRERARGRGDGRQRRVGGATVEAFAAAGWDVAILARGEARLRDAAEAVRQRRRRALALAVDVADAEAVDAAAAEIERRLGPIEVWVNNAMATVFGPVAELSAAEAARGTAVTYLGQVHGTMAALRHMRPRNRGAIINVGSALSYRAIPLQSIYCAAKFAVRGFTDALRSELIHDRSAVRVTMVHLSAMNTPQFDWARNKTGHRAQPVPPIFAPEVAARAILFAATHARREIWVGFPTVRAIVANRLFPGLLGRYLAGAGYRGQLMAARQDPAAPGNLFAPVAGPWAADGRFRAQARHGAWEMWTSRHRDELVAVGLGLGIVASARALRRLRR